MAVDDSGNLYVGNLYVVDFGIAEFRNSHLQTRHTGLRNFPLIGHGRYLMRPCTARVGGGRSRRGLLVGPHCDLVAVFPPFPQDETWGRRTFQDKLRRPLR